MTILAAPSTVDLALASLEARFETARLATEVTFAAAEVLGLTLGADRAGYVLADATVGAVLVEGLWGLPLPASDTLSFADFGTSTQALQANLPLLAVPLRREPTQNLRTAAPGTHRLPVLGRPDAAARGELNILAGGPAAAIDIARPIFDVIGGSVWEMGPEAPTANAAKVACNMMIAMAIEAMAEAMVLTEANGLPREDFIELILGTLFGSRSYQIYSGNILRRDYQPGFKAVLGLKDIRLAKEAARRG